MFVGRHRRHRRDAESPDAFSRAHLDACLLYMLSALVAIIAVVTAAA